MQTPQPIRISKVHGLGRAQFHALATGVTVLTSAPNRIAAATLEVRSELAAIDATCSRLRPDSELESVNRDSGRPVQVSALLWEAIAVAMRAARLTSGDVDPTVGAPLRALGYERDFAVVDRDNPAPTVKMAPAFGWQTVELDEASRTVSMPAGVRLDLGATAMALASDRAARRAAAVAGCGVLVRLGGDISTSGEAPGRGWNVRIADRHGAHPSSAGPVVRIDFGGLATTSTSMRRCSRGGTEADHIVDPISGAPADAVWRTVSVAASSCVDANIASTASIVRGERAVPWLNSLAYPARLVRPDGRTVVTAGWPVEKVAA
jgi:thiamine biosynthesis lipoprotein